MVVIDEKDFDEVNFNASKALFKSFAEFPLEETLGKISV